jgi:IS30 family transposase
MSTIPASIKRGRLTEIEETAIAAFAEKGWSAGKIALRLNRHPGTINFALHRLGLKTPVERIFNYTRASGSEVRSFSPDEDAFIEALRCQDFKLQQIADLAAKRTGHRRTAATIGIRLKMLANRAEAG